MAARSCFNDNLRLMVSFFGNKYIVTGSYNPQSVSRPQASSEDEEELACGEGVRSEVCEASGKSNAEEPEDEYVTDDETPIFLMPEAGTSDTLSVKTQKRRNAKSSMASWICGAVRHRPKGYNLQTPYESEGSVEFVETPKGGWNISTSRGMDESAAPESRRASTWEMADESRGARRKIRSVKELPVGKKEQAKNQKGKEARALRLGKPVEERQC